ncbi:MAG TPA: T9SS type A sorting domain-containing protein [Ignavibacteriaceae bacterium]
MKNILQALLFTLFIFSLSNAQIVILDDFETGAGHFNVQTDYSGSTVGILGTQPTLDSSTAAFGTKSIRIELIDNPGQAVDWACRFLSGIGSPASNVNMAPNGWTGYWLKTNRSWVRTAPIIDAPQTGEDGDTAVVIGDDQWHLYQWNLGLDGQPYWKGWATGNDTISDDPTPTYDGIWFFAPDGSDTTVIYLDQVTWNPDGELPVELVSFNASVDKNTINLRWITSTELNNSGFEVERRTANSSYKKIAFVQGKGTTTQSNGYTYSDVVNQTGIYIYRLKQVDLDGTFEYSNEIMVNVIALPGQYALAQNYPNPFNPTTSIEYVIPQAGFVNLSVFNLLGERVAELVNEIMESGNHTIVFDASKFSSGTYIYTLSVNGNVVTKKMTLIK